MSASKNADLAIASIYPTGTVLVCHADDQGKFPMDLLNQAFTHEALTDEALANTNTDFPTFVIVFDESVTADDVVLCISEAFEEFRIADTFGELFPSRFEVLENGAPVDVRERFGY